MDRTVLPIVAAGAANRSRSRETTPTAQMPRTRRRAAVRTGLMFMLMTLSLTCLLPAHVADAAASGALTCAGTENESFAPAVTNTLRNVQITIDDLFGPCPVTPDPQLTGGTFHITITRPVSCTNFFLPPAHPETYRWNDGAQSTVEFTTAVAVNEANGSTEVILTGTVTSGLDAGFIATKTVILPAFSLACDTTGLQTLSGPVTIAFA